MLRHNYCVYMTTELTLWVLILSLLILCIAVAGMWRDRRMQSDRSVYHESARIRRLRDEYIKRFTAYVDDSGPGDKARD